MHLFNDFTFWHVNEYYDTNGLDWQIRVGSFKFNECGDPGFNISSSNPSQAICTGDDAIFNLSLGSLGAYDGVVTLSVTGAPGGTSTVFSANPVPSLPGSTSLTIGNTASVPGNTYSLNVLGTSPTVDNKNISLVLDVYDVTPISPGLTSPADGATNQDTQPSLNWSGAATLEYTVEVATDAGFSNVVFTGSTPGTTLVPTTNLNTSTTYYWRAIANNSCGDSLYSDTYSFTTIAAPGDCSINQVANVLYEYDFESGLGDWTSSSDLDPVGLDIWNISTVTANSGTNSILAVDVANISDQMLTSPPIQIPVDEFPISMQFWNKQIIEDNTGGTACWDGGLLEISTDNGVNFNQVLNDKMLTDPYNGLISASYQNPAGGLEGWCGDPQDWLNSIVDFNDYAGQEVIFRFRLGTDNVVAHEGWYIDDVKVQSCVAEVIVCDLPPPIDHPDIIWFNGFQCVEEL